MRYPALVSFSCLALTEGNGAKGALASIIGRKKRNLVNIGDVASNAREVIAAEELLTAPSSSPYDFPTFSQNKLPSSIPSLTPVKTIDPAGTTAPTDFCSVQVSVTCTPPPNFEDCDSINEFREECFEKPFSMGFRYNGGDCSQEFNEQSPLIYHCQDYNGGPPASAGEESYIVVTDIMGRGITFFEGFVPVSGLFQINNPNTTLKLESNINVTIYSSNVLTPGNIRQTMIIHTSCSQVTFLKDRYGAAELLWFNNTIQGNTTCAIDLEFGFEVTNVDEKFDADLISLTSVTNFPGAHFINLTNVVAGDTLSPGQTFFYNFNVSLDTSIRQEYTTFTTIQGSTRKGLNCRNTDFLNFTAGNTNTAPFFNIVPAPSIAPAVPSIPTHLPSSSSPSSIHAPTTTAGKTEAPTRGLPTFSCPSIPEGGCSICGDESCIGNPDAIFSFAGQPSISCSDLQKAGEDGLVPLEQCAFLPDLVSQVCECQVPGPSVLVQSPTSRPTCGTASPMLMHASEMLSFSVTTKKAPGSLRPVTSLFSCATIPVGGCSICGENSCVTNPDAIFSFPGQPNVACGTLQKAGYDGNIHPYQCAQLPFLVFDVCQCEIQGESFSSILYEGLSMKSSVLVDDIVLGSPETDINGLYDLLASVGIHGGEEFRSAKSYQSRAMVWLSKHGGLWSMDDRKKIQRYTLACIYFSTYSVTTPYTEVKYGTIKPPGWITSTDWLNPYVDECEWFGVDCDSNNAVSSIGLSNNRLTGSLPPEVILLKDSLIRLDISDNLVWNAGYEGNAFLGELAKLEYLNYGYTNFHYHDGIPMQIGMLTNLVRYNCSYTLYRGALKGDVFHHLSLLNHLAIGGNSYHSAVPMELGQYLPKLEYLYIEDADLIGDLSFITDLSSIKELWLDMNPKLQGSLPSTFGSFSLPNLESLSISNCGLTGTIPTEVGSMINLQQVWLNGNHLTGHIPTELANLIHLHTLDLEDNHQSGSMPKEICFNLPSFGRLKILQTDCNRVSCTCCTLC